MKTKTTYYCQNCGAQYSKWMGQCTTCKQWNTVVEEIVSKKDLKTGGNPSSKIKSKVTKLTDIDTSEEYRISTNNQELDRVLGGA